MSNFTATAKLDAYLHTPSLRDAIPICMHVIELGDREAPGEHRHVPAEQIHEHAFARLEHRGEHRILGETPAAFEYVQHVSNLRSHGLRAGDRASWLAAICPEMGISATEDGAETDRSI